MPDSCERPESILSEASLAAVLTATSPALAAWTAFGLLGIALARVGRLAEGALVVDQALARPGISEIWRARLQARQAIGLAETAQVDRAAEVAQQALAAAERTSDRFAAGYALHTMAFVAYRRLEPGLHHIDRALEVVGDDPQATDLRLLLLSNRAATLGLLDRHAEADR